MTETEFKGQDFEKSLAEAASGVAEFDDSEGGAGRKFQTSLHSTPSLVPLIVLAASLIVFGVLEERFFRAGTLTLIMQQIAVVGILGVAQSLVILTAGIDLSVGAFAVFTSVIMGQFTNRRNGPPRRENGTAKKTGNNSVAMDTDAHTGNRGYGLSFAGICVSPDAST